MTVAAHCYSVTLSLPCDSTSVFLSVNTTCASVMLSHIQGGGYLTCGLSVNATCTSILVSHVQGGGYLTCGNCAGDGSVPVSVAQTTARNGGEETCPFCSGTGKVMCTACLVSMSTLITIFSTGLFVPPP
jgi:hypothetical protein